MVVEDWGVVNEQSLNELWEIVLERWDGEGGWEWHLLSLSWWRDLVGKCVESQEGVR